MVNAPMLKLSTDLNLSIHKARPSEISTNQKGGEKNGNRKNRNRRTRTAGTDCGRNNGSTSCGEPSRPSRCAGSAGRGIGREERRGKEGKRPIVKVLSFR